MEFNHLGSFVCFIKEFSSLRYKSWRRERLPTPVFQPGEFCELYSPWGHKELDMTERLIGYLGVGSLAFSFGYR